MKDEVLETRKRFEAKQRELFQVFELAKAGENVYDLGRKEVLERLGVETREDAIAAVKKLNQELDTLGRELEQAELAEIKKIAEKRDEARNVPLRAPQHPATSTSAKSLGELFVESRQYQEYKATKIPQAALIDISVKTLFERAAGFPPESVRSGLIVPAVAFQLAEILEIIPVFSISQGVFKYMEEQTRTHAATETAEGAGYPESTFEFIEKSSNVEKIADSIPVTDEQLEDESQVASLLDQRLRFGVRRRLANQILNGNGTSPNLRGILNVTGIQTQAKGTDSIMAAAYKAITKVRFTGQAEPTAFVFHPNDWQEVVLAQESTGNFLWGHPSMGPVTSLWGIPVALSVAVPEGTGLVGDFRNFARIDERRGIEVQVGFVGTQFTEGKRTLRADMRAAFTVTRPAAFCTITGI